MRSSLAYSYQVEHGDGYRTFMESVEQLQLAEGLGFDTVLVSEHHLVENGYFPAPAVTNGALAMCTKKLRIGPGVLLLPLYNPLHVAEHGTILDVISNGRYILGVGQGYRKEEFEAFQIPLTDRPARMREGIEAIRALWTQPTANYHGKHFTYENVTLRPLPTTKPHPPIWMAAKMSSAVKMAARVADAWFADPVTPLAVMKERMVEYKATLQSVNKPTSGFEFSLWREAHCAETDELALKQAWEPMLYIYREYLDWGHMLDEQGNPVPPGDERALGLLRSRFIIGSPETCIRECQKYAKELGATNLVMRMKFPGLSHRDVSNSIKLWGEKVMPHIQ